MPRIIFDLSLSGSCLFGEVHQGSCHSSM